MQATRSEAGTPVEVDSVLNPGEASLRTVERYPSGREQRRSPIAPLLTIMPSEVVQAAYTGQTLVLVLGLEEEFTLTLLERLAR